MAENKDGAELTEEPTQRKLDESRKKGDVARSQDILQFASLAGAFGVLAVLGGWLMKNLVAQLTPFLAHAGQLSLSGGDGQHLAGRILQAVLPTMLAVAVGAAVTGVGASFLQQGLILSPGKVSPDFQRVSPMAGLKRMFGVEGLSHFVLSLLKTVAVGAVAWWVMAPQFGAFINLAGLEPASVMTFMMDLLKRMLIGVLMLTGLLGGLDFFWQRQQFMNRMRMTKEEVKEDYKQTEGDPHAKARYRQIRMERARRRMMQAVPKATVVVMNPTHYAVALYYEPGQTEAPECVAKGLDDVALRIRAIAEENGVPVVEDPPLARALFATVEIDEQIPQQHFEAVAKIIGFILSAAKRAPARARGL